MNLQSSQLEAFKAVAKHLSFSKGAAAIHITQSAISHRIKNLEEELGYSLFLRHPSGIKLTAVGELLLRFCQSCNTLEEELFRDLSAQIEGELAGYIRIASYSSVLRSVVIPSLTTLLKQNQKVQCEFIYRGMKDLATLLQKGEVEFIVTDYAIDKNKIDSQLLGYETYVVIESAQTTSNSHTYLDNAPDDMATENFFRSQNNPLPKYKRLFLSDCYGIIDGVEAGLGRAVMPQHLLRNNPRVRIVEGFKPYVLEVYLHYFAQPYYSTLQKVVISEITSHAPSFLSKAI